MQGHLHHRPCTRESLQKGTAHLSRRFCSTNTPAGTSLTKRPATSPCYRALHHRLNRRKVLESYGVDVASRCQRVQCDELWGVQDLAGALCQASRGSGSWSRVGWLEQSQTVLMATAEAYTTPPWPLG